MKEYGVLFKSKNLGARRIGDALYFAVLLFLNKTIMAISCAILLGK